MTGVRDALVMIPLRELAGMFAGALVYGGACGAVGWFFGFVGRR
ncbi:hypothetical protein [Actinomadura rubrisoli]|nr:hypothetical protein [Actinomadura rubrisoli]